MKREGILYFYGFAIFILSISLACGSGATPTVPVILPTQTRTPAATETSTAAAGTQQQYTRFSAPHDLFSAEVPSDWSYSSAWVSSKKNGTPPDTLEFSWTSPDRHGAVVFLEYDDGHKVAAAKLGNSAVRILNNYFARNGDSVNITENNPLADGIIQLNWKLVQNKKNGTTYVYERGSNIIVLSTFFDSVYSDTFTNTFADITNSYKVP